MEIVEKMTPNKLLNFLLYQDKISHDNLTFRDKRYGFKYAIYYFSSIYINVVVNQHHFDVFNKGVKKNVSRHTNHSLTSVYPKL